jgi:DNA-binding response OmpR family regulator
MQAGLDRACPPVLSSATNMAADTPLQVLIAEDEPAMLSLVARHVRALGFSVVEASDGDAAWALAQVHHPDLVILDVMMPGMSGWEVCKRVKSPAANGAFASTGVIMLTGIGENLNDMTSPLFAADTWLNKPFDFADLEARIHETLEKFGKAFPQPGEKRKAAIAAAKRVSTKRAAAKKAASKKAGAKKAVAKPATKKAAPKKAASKARAKPATRRTVAAKKPTAKKSAATKKPAAKPAAKKPAAKKPAAKKSARAK